MKVIIGRFGKKGVGEQEKEWKVIRVRFWKKGNRAKEDGSGKLLL